MTPNVVRNIYATMLSWFVDNCQSWEIPVNHWTFFLGGKLKISYWGFVCFKNHSTSSLLSLWILCLSGPLWTLEKNKVSVASSHDIFPGPLCRLLSRLRERFSLAPDLPCTTLSRVASEECKKAFSSSGFFCSPMNHPVLSQAHRGKERGRGR